MTCRDLLRHSPFFAVLLTGCTPYIQTQMSLAEQARRGVELVRQAQDQRQQLIERFCDLQRQRLDEAFDADVQERPDLPPAWIIEHRKAYAAALDALHAQRQSSRDADAATRDNLAAIDRALERLLALQSAQLKLLEFNPRKP